MKCAIAPPSVESRSSSEFERMRQSTQRRAYAMALQMTRSASDAEDLVQDTYVKAWRFFDSYHPGRPFLNWLLRIMQRAYLDSLRRENPIRRAESLNTMVSPSDGEVQEIPIADNSFNAEQELLMEEFVKELQSALKELPEVYRKAIILCDIEELSYQEIAERQGTTVGTVRSRIHRGRRMLREAAMRKGLQIPVR